MPLVSHTEPPQHINPWISSISKFVSGILHKLAAQCLDAIVFGPTIM